MEILFEKELEETSKKLVLLRQPSTASFRVIMESLVNDLKTDSSDSPGTMIATYKPRFSDVPMPEEFAAKLTVDLGSLSEDAIEDFFKVSYVDNLTRMMLDTAIDTSGSEPALAPVLAKPAPKTEVMFVVNLSGKVIFGVRPEDVRRPHPTLVGEDDPEVLSGGTISMLDGLIYEVRDDSGHFRPDYTGFESLLRAFSALPSEVFHPDFQGFKPYGGSPVIPDYTAEPSEGKGIVAFKTILGDLLTTISLVETRIANDLKSLKSQYVKTNLGALQKILGRHGTILDALHIMRDRIVLFSEKYGSSLGDKIGSLVISKVAKFVVASMLEVDRKLFRDAADAGSVEIAQRLIAGNHLVLEDSVAFFKDLRSKG